MINTKETYNELKKRHQEGIDSFEHWFFAFSNDQLEEGLKRLNTDAKRHSEKFGRRRGQNTAVEVLPYRTQTRALSYGRISGRADRPDNGRVFPAELPQLPSPCDLGSDAESAIYSFRNFGELSGATRFRGSRHHGFPWIVGAVSRSERFAR